MIEGNNFCKKKNLRKEIGKNKEKEVILRKGKNKEAKAKREEDKEVLVEADTGEKK